jgi:hypothetical protein
LTPFAERSLFAFWRGWSASLRGSGHDGSLGARNACSPTVRFAAPALRGNERDAFVFICRQCARFAMAVKPQACALARDRPTVKNEP